MSQEQNKKSESRNPKPKKPDKIDLSMFLDEYLNDAKAGFQKVNSNLLALEKDHSQIERLDEIFRVFHTLKSSSTMLEFLDIAKLAHISEDLLDRMRKSEVPVTQETIDLLFEVIDTLEAMVKGRAKGKSESIESQTVAEKVKKITLRATYPEKGELHKVKTAIMPTIEKIQTVRVDVELLDSLFNQVGELIITKNRIDNIVSDTATKELKNALAEMGRIISAMQENVSTARLVPVDEIFQKFPRMVRDLARERHKEIELILEGREIELDKAILDAISEPLIHLLRNAVDHGIEPAEQRQKQNKKKSGTIKLAAKRAENHILIDVQDDGGGIDIERMKEVAVGKGFVKPEEAKLLEDKDVLSLLFKPGFSSLEQVSDLSGRGVGLDVVETSAKRLGGTVEVATQKGKGTRFTLKLPLSTAVMQTLMVGVGEHVFSIPSNIVLETLEVKPEDLKEIRKQQVMVLRQEVIPFVKLNEVLNIPHQEDQENLIAIIIYRGDKFIGLGVDEVLDQMENIIKPFDPIAQQFKGFTGGTILGDGRVALLLDIPTLLGFETLQEERYST